MGKPGFPCLLKKISYGRIILLFPHCFPGKENFFFFLSSFKNDLFEVKFKGRYIDLEELESEIIMQGDVKKKQK